MYSVSTENDMYAPLDSESYVSDVFESLNWGQVFIESMKAQQFTLNFHHCYLEGLNIVSVHGDVTILSFSLGS
jgi:hypothetical protein